MSCLGREDGTFPSGPKRWAHRGGNTRDQHAKKNSTQNVTAWLTKSAEENRPFGTSEAKSRSGNSHPVLLYQRGKNFKEFRGTA